jgi:hypothetical protein
MVAGSAANITRFARLAAGVAIVLPGIAGIVAGMPLSLELQQRPVVAWIVAGTAAAVAVVGGKSRCSWRSRGLSQDSPGLKMVKL